MTPADLVARLRDPSTCTSWRQVDEQRAEAADEIERLLGLFHEAKAHPASAWWYVCKALGEPTILSAAFAAAAPAAHPPP